MSSQVGSGASEAYFEAVQKLLATNNLYKSLLLNSQNIQALQNMQALQQLQASNAAGLGLSQLQMLCGAMAANPALSQLHLGGGSGAAPGGIAGLPPATLAALVALQGRAVQPSGSLPTDTASLVAALQLRLPSQIGSADGSLDRSAGLPGGGLERLLAALQPAPAVGTGGGLQLPPISLPAGGSGGPEDATRALRSGGLVGQGAEGAASAENVVSLLAALVSKAYCIMSTEDGRLEASGNILDSKMQV